MPTADQIIEWLKLQPNSVEGGYFAGTYESGVRIPVKNSTSLKNEETRSLCSAIYYFLEPNGRSLMHKVEGDMIYHFYSGDPVEMLLLYPEGHSNKLEICVFSNDIAAGCLPMKVIPGGTWLGSHIAPGGTYSLMGVTMSPGFDPKDYILGLRKDLISKYPEQSSLITELTKEK